MRKSRISLALIPALALALAAFAGAARANESSEPVPERERIGSALNDPGEPSETSDAPEAKPSSQRRWYDEPDDARGGESRSALARRARKALDDDEYLDPDSMTSEELENKRYYAASYFFNRYQPFPAISSTLLHGKRDHFAELAIGYEFIESLRATDFLRLSGVGSIDVLTPRESVRDVRSFGIELRAGERERLGSTDGQADLFPFWRTAFLDAEVSTSLRFVERRLASSPQETDRGAMLTLDGSGGALGAYTVRASIRYEWYSTAPAITYMAGFEILRPALPAGLILAWRGRDSAIGHRSEFVIGLRIEL